MKLRVYLRSRPVRTALKLVLVVLAVSAVVYRLGFAPVLVATHEIQPGTVIGEVMGTGTLEPRVKTTISPRIQEQLAEVLVDQGDWVKAGQLLARLDDGELKQRVEVSTAELAVARATAERVRVDQARAEAVDHQARLNHTRLSELLATQVTTQADLDKATEQLQIAAADLRRARAAIVEAERQVITAEKNLAYQRERLSYAQLLSPYDGLVVRRDRDPGGVVVPGSSILHLICTNEIWVSAWVDETASAALSPGQPARVVFRSDPSASYPGKVARLGREADRETREFLVDVRVRELPHNWTIGQRAEVFIETGRRLEALTVPQQFVQWRGGKAGVFVNDRGKARWREVTTGLRGRETVEIAQGVSAGEQVVQPGKGKRPGLSDGQRVTVR